MSPYRHLCRFRFGMSVFTLKMAFDVVSADFWQEDTGAKACARFFSVFIESSSR